MTDFYFPERYDLSVAEEGVWFDVVDENDVVWGEFKCILLDQTVPHYKVALERLNRKFNAVGNKKRKKAGDDFAAELLVEMSLRDWRINDAKGKAIPYSPETAIEYFTHPQGAYVMSKLSPMISDVKNFQPEEQGDALGN